MFSDFFNRSKENILNYYAIFPVVVLVAFTLGRGFGNTLFYISLLSFFPFFVMHRSDWRELKNLFLVYGAWVFSLFIIFLINGSNDYKTLSIFILSSFLGLALSKVVFDRWDFFITWAPRVVLCLMLYHIFEIAYYYATDGSSPASDIQTWDFVVLAPLLLLTKKSRGLKVLYCALIFLIVLLSASRTQMLAVLLALIGYFAFVNKKMVYFLIGLPIALVITIFLNQLFRSKIAFDNLEFFFSRITSRRSDIWLEALEKNSSYWFGNGLSSTIDVTGPHGIASMHNIFMELYWELGLVSVVVFLLFILYFLKKIKLVYNLDSIEDRKNFAIIISIFIVCFCMLLLDKSFTNFVPRFFFYFILGLIYALSSNFGRNFNMADKVFK